MTIRLTWSEYKEFANKAIKEKFPNIIDDDTVKFTRIVTHEGECEIYEYPEFVEIQLED